MVRADESARAGKRHSLPLRPPVPQITMLGTETAPGSTIIFVGGLQPFPEQATYAASQINTHLPIGPQSCQDSARFLATSSPLMRSCLLGPPWRQR